MVHEMLMMVSRLRLKSSQLGPGRRLGRKASRSRRLQKNFDFIFHFMNLIVPGVQSAWLDVQFLIDMPGWRRLKVL